MRHTVHKWFWAWDFDKEEAWLNEMADKGLCLVSVGFCTYMFEDCAPGEYRICLQLLEQMPNHPESKQYIEFLSDTGAEHIGSLFRWAYFRQKAADGEFALFSDNASRLKHLSGIIALIAVITAVNLLIGIQNLTLAFRVSDSIGYAALLNLAVGLLGTFGCIRLTQKRKKLRQDSQLFE